MNCEQAEVEITSLEPSPEARAHLESCTTCQALQRETAQFLKQIALPSVSAIDQQRLDQLPQVALAEFTREQRRRSSLRHMFGYAVAAGVGALVSAAVFTHGTKVESAVSAKPDQAVVAASDDSSIHYSDDEVFPEVSWPGDADASDSANNADVYGDLQ